MHQEYVSLRKFILDHYEALAAVAVQWASGAVRLLSGGTSSPSSRPSSPPPSRVSFAAAALRLNEGEITRTTDDMSRVRLGHDEVEVYADHAAGNSGAEHPKGALKNPSHDTEIICSMLVRGGICLVGYRVSYYSIIVYLPLLTWDSLAHGCYCRRRVAPCQSV